MKPARDPAAARRQLLLLIGLFLLPPVAAFLAWGYLGEHGVSATTNAGTLIRPARPLDLDGLGAEEAAAEVRGRWLYLVQAADGCDAQCEQQLYLTRQTRIAVNKDTPRVRRLLLLGGDVDAALRQRLQREHPDLVLVERAHLPLSVAGTPADSFYLVDPLGNLMMSYGADVDPRGILRDLQKLLKISQVG